jgi:toxin CptA
MSIVLASTAFAIAALCAGLMGYAIQRGATCTVAAMDEVVTKRSARRLASLVEAALWVGGGLLLAQALGMLPRMPAGYAASGWTVLGGALLGFGAWINGACVFGAIARLGSGQWAYVVTPLGFYVGCLSVGPLFAMPAAPKLDHGSPVLQAPLWVALLFVAFALWRASGVLFGSAGERASGMAARWHRALAARVWSPHMATTVIGITFVVMLLAVGAWAYTDVLAELARGMATDLPARSLLLLALLLGAMAGGWTAGRWRHTPPTAAQLARCFAGGVAMGWGSLLIPGGNDGLILVGMPLAWPYAWLAFATMCVTIGAAQLLQRARRTQMAGGHVS